MSTSHQEASPEQQRSELTRLAEREGLTITRWYDGDLGITGDSGPERRPDFGRMLQAAKQNEFDVLLAWDLKRVGRFDSLDAGKWLGTLRDAGITIATVVDGTFDLGQSFDRMKLGFSAENGHSENVSRAAAVTRGMLSVAKAGFRSGGPPPYGFGRGEYTADGVLVRRLAADERKSKKSNFVGLVPCEDQDKLAAVLYAYQRFDGASISIRALSRELRDKGFPAPTEGWTHRTVGAMLRNPAYAGINRWNYERSGRYYSVTQGTPTRRLPRDIVRQQNTDGDVILADSPCEGLVPKELWERAQRKFRRLANRQRRTRESHPLSGLMFCGHCGETMHKHRRSGFLCKTYRNHGRENDSGCGYHTIEAGAVLDWLTRTLQELLLGPGRSALVAEIVQQLKSKTTTGDSDTRRLEKRLRELDQEIVRLRSAIRKIDDDGLMEALTDAKGERETVARELSSAGRFTTEADIEAEAEKVADEAWSMGERLASTDPAVVANAVSKLVSRIECTWTPEPRGSGDRVRCVLATGHVILKRNDPLCEVFRNGPGGFPPGAPTDPNVRN